MLDTFKRMFTRGGAGVADWRPVGVWAKAEGHAFKRARDGQGFIIEGELNGRPWRLEWGPSQRNYITGPELRIRIDAGLPSALQMLVLTRPLMDELERQTFERYTEGLQTHIDSSTPEEMRWLAMFPKVNLSALKPMKARFGAVSSLPSMASAWVDGPLLAQLEGAGDGLLSGEPPFVLMTLRGRVYLRVQLTEPTVQVVQQAMAIFTAAISQAAHASQALGEGASPWPGADVESVDPLDTRSGPTG